MSQRSRYGNVLSMDGPIRILVAVDQTQEWGRSLYKGAWKRASLGRNWTVHKRQNRPWDGLLTHLREQQYDGAILHLAVDYLDDEFADLGIPIVTTSNTTGNSRFPSVRNDDEQAGRMAGRYLQQCGYRDVQFLHNRTGYSEERLKGLKEIFPETTVHSELGNETLHPLKQSGRSTAWVGSDDGQASTFLKWAAGHGVHFPLSGGVMGFNNDEHICLNTEPTLTSVVMCFEQLGEKATDVLAELMEETNPGTPTICRVRPSGIEARGSTTADGIRNRTVRDAVRLIQQAQGDVGTEELLETLTCTRRALELAFKKELNTTPHQYILRIRAERAKRLLIESNRSVTDIAITCGFSGPTQIGAVFQRLYGMSPTRIRNLE